MKCHELNLVEAGEPIDGLVIRMGKGGLHVPILGQHRWVLPVGPISVAFLDDSLAHQSAFNRCGADLPTEPLRLLRCDVDKRSKLWLLDETPETKNHALILATGFRWMNSLTVSVEGTGSEILGQTKVRNANNGLYKGVSVLAMLPPGGRLVWRAKASVARWRGSPVFMIFEAQSDGAIKKVKH